MSKNAGKSEMKSANRLMRDNIARLEALNVPTIEAQRIALEAPELIDQLEAEILGRSRFEDIQMDPRLDAINRAALEDVAGIAAAGGFDAQTRLNLEEGLARAFGAGQARRQQLEEDPTLGQGQKLALKIQAGQEEGQAARNVALQSAAQAQQARMAALGQQASMASGMQQQQLGLKTQKATRADEIALENKRAKEAIDLFNTQQRQNIANMGTATRNQMEIANKGLIPQQFQMQLAKATGVTGAQSNLAQQMQQQAAAAQAAQQAQNAAIISAAGTVAGASMGKKA